MQDLIMNEFKKVFPECGIFASKWAMDKEGFYIFATIGKDKSEFSNGIVQNDPLSLNIKYFKEDDYIELSCSFSIKPENAMFYASSVKLRNKKIKIKSVNEKTIHDYFITVYNLIMDNKDNWHPSNIELLNKKFH